MSHFSNFNGIQKVLPRVDLNPYSIVERTLELFPFAFKGVIVLSVGVNAKSCGKPVNP